MDGTKLATKFQSKINVRNLPNALKVTFEILPRLTFSCIERERAFDDNTLAQTFVFGFLGNPDANSRDLAQTAGCIGIPITPGAIDYWIDKSSTAESFKNLIVAAVNTVVIANPADVELLKRFTGVHLLDSTVITLPDELKEIWIGCGTDRPHGGKAALKIQVRYDVLNGGLLIDLVPGTECDQKAEMKWADLQSGSIHIRDLGYFDLDALETIDQQESYYVTRMMHGTKVYDLEGKEISLLEYLRSQPGDVDRWVLVGKQKKLKTRLLARRLPEWVSEKRRRKCNEKAKKKGRTASQEQLNLRSWTILLTNVSGGKPEDSEGMQEEASPEEASREMAEITEGKKSKKPWLSLEEAIALTRLRWQIELLFKLWKSHGKLASSHRFKPQRILCELYAKLLTVIVGHWVMLKGNWQMMERSLVKASKAVQKAAYGILRGLNCIERLDEELKTVVVMIVKTSKVNRRKKNPAAFQVIGDPTRFGYDRCA